MFKFSVAFATGVLAAVLPIAPTAVARADIFQWEYVNPADPSQGKQQSATLVPDGAGVNVAPAANLTNRNLSMAYLHGANLADASARYANLTGAELSQAIVTGVDFSGYVVVSEEGGYTVPGANLTGATLVGVDASGANFHVATLSGADFSGANQ